MSMSDRGRDEIRRSVLGADRAFRVIKGDGAEKGPPTGGAPGGGSDDDACPVRALGYNDLFHFLDSNGRPAALTARELGSRAALSIKLFLGDEAWLRKRFPRKKKVPDETGGEKEITVDFLVNSAAAWLARECRAAGIWGQRVQLRQPGIWRGEDGFPIVHCGDTVLIGEDWHPAGLRTGNQIWAAGEPTARPGAPCEKMIGEQLQRDLQDYFAFRSPGAAVALVGLIATGYLSGALDWRPNAFITGGTGSGKSALRNVIRAAWPVHDYSNDTSKAGMEQTIAGRAIPAVIDESNDRNRSSGRDLIDLVLSASGDEGTKLARGTADGRGRSSQVVSSVIMFSINAPELEPQHLNRFVVIEMCQPEAGADFRAEHRRIPTELKRHASALWGRALAAWERYGECLEMFRGALRDAGCSPREMDGKGALLAGWYILTHEGLPDDRALREGVGALGEFVVTARQAASEDGPRRCMRHLLGFPVTLFRSTDREPIGLLIEQAFGENDEGHTPSNANDILGRIGIRVVRRCGVIPERRASRDPREPCRCTQCWDMRQARRIPRVGPDDQLWIANRNVELTRIFEKTEFDAGRWRQELQRVEGAAPSGRNIRIGGVSGSAVWLPRAALPLDDGDDPLDSG